ncbi:MAG: LytTR family DNA-binding domain-containing protein [Eubacterium sp.]
MKITVEINENCIEDEVVIRCHEVNDMVNRIQRAVSDITKKETKIRLIKGNKEYYISIDDILFFESDDSIICAHTISDIFVTKYKLYELEQILPWHFSRISKSAILNVKKVYSITKNITASSVIEFKETPKQVYVSRAYYKPLMSKIEEMRNV